MMASRLSLLVGSLFIAYTGLAQCPSVAQRLHRLDSVVILPNDQQTAALLMLKNQDEACHQTTDSLYARCLHRLGVMAFQKSDYLLSTQYARQSIRVNSLPRRDVNRSFRVKTYYNLARAQQASGALLQAREAYQSMIRIGNRTPLYQDLVADAYGNLSHLYSVNADYQKAVEQAELGAQLAARINKPDKLVFNLNANAAAQKEVGHYDVAEQLLMQVLGLLKKISVQTVDVANTYSDLAGLRQRQGRYPDARQYYEKALMQHRLIKNEYGQAEILANMGYLEFQYLQNGKRALTFYREALPLMGQQEGKARILDNIGVVYWKQHRFAEATATYQQAFQTLSITSKTEHNPSADRIRLSPYKEYLLTLIQDKADTWLDWAKATNNDRQRLQHALNTYQVADQMIDYMRWEHTGQQSKVFWREKTRGMYERAIETCYRLGDARQAFHFFEKSRAVMLADQLNELGARQQLSAKQVADEQHLRQAVGEQQTKLAGIKPDSSVYTATRMALLAKQDSLDTFLKQLEISNPTYYRYKYDNVTPSLTDVQQYLKARQSAFVTYFVGDSALYVLGVTGDKATLRRQPVGDYTRTTRQFMRLLANPEAMNRTATVARFLTLGRDLYQQLLAPLNVPAGRVIVSPDGSFIPFETLSRSAAQPDYLVKTYAFSYAYSAHLLLKSNTATTRTAGLATGDFLGVAPVAFAPSLGQATLSGSDEALKPIAARFGSSVLLTHGMATRRAFRADVSAFRVVHLFTHATADTTDQEPTLYFADSTLRLSDLGDGALPNVELVVLAACKTGIGAVQRGEGVFSLARGFSALGVPSVLTTLWSVQNDATYRLTNSFYMYVDQGLPKDIALQRAKQDWLVTASGTDQLPNYWAGLILIGDTSPLDRPVPWPWIAGGALLLLGAGGGARWWRRRNRERTETIPHLTRLA